MKRSHLSILITAAFFAGIVLLVLTSNDSHVIAMRVLVYLAVAVSISIASFYSKQPSTEVNGQTRFHKMDSILKDAKKFSDEYGDLYVLADKLKQQRKYRQRKMLSHRH